MSFTGGGDDEMKLDQEGGDTPLGDTEDHPEGTLAGSVRGSVAGSVAEEPKPVLIQQVVDTRRQTMEAQNLGVEKLQESEPVKVIKNAAGGGGGGDAPPKRHRGGWASSAGSRRETIVNTEEADTRLLVRDDTEEDSNIPAIPDLEDMQEEDLTTQMAVAPSMSGTRVITYKQLNADLSKQAGLFTLDNEIDLKLLAKVLSPEGDVVEEDKQWEWDKVFAELSPDIQTTWNSLAARGLGGKKNIPAAFKAVLASHQDS